MEVKGVLATFLVFQLGDMQVALDRKIKEQRFGPAFLGDVGDERAIASWTDLGAYGRPLEVMLPPSG